MGQRPRQQSIPYRRPYVEPEQRHEQIPVEWLIVWILAIGGGLGLAIALIQNFWWDGISESVGRTLLDLERELQNLSR